MINIRVISNGFGEDQIAAHLIEAFQRQIPHVHIMAYPLVGQGLEFQKRHIPIEWTNPVFPSGGFIRDLKTLWKDLREGLISHHFRQFQRLRNTVKEVDFTLCVGDFFCLGLGRFLQPHRVYFLPTAKSDAFMPHSFIERKLMARWTQGVFTRDNATAASLNSYSIPAFFLGNPMMDNIQLKHVLFDIPEGKKVVGLLPGSREEAYGNLDAMLELAKKVQQRQPSLYFLIAKAPALSTDRLQNKLFQNCELSECFWDVLKASHAIIGLSGTANEQAVYVGKTVFCFEGTGPQSTPQRFKEQGCLLGAQLRFFDSIDSLESELLAFLEERSIPEWNPPSQLASEAIVGAILAQL